MTPSCATLFMLEEFHCELFSSPSPSNWKRLSSWFLFFFYTALPLCLSVYQVCCISPHTLNMTVSSRELSFSILSLHLIFCPSHAHSPSSLVPSLLALCLPFFSFRPDPRMQIHSTVDVFFSLPSTSSPARKRRIWRDSWELLLLLSSLFFLLRAGCPDHSYPKEFRARNEIIHCHLCYIFFYRWVAESRGTVVKT